MARQAQQTSHKRSRRARRAVAAATALLLGGGGLVALNVRASADEEGAPPPRTASATVDCPDVAHAVRNLPDGSRRGVDAELAAVDDQITEAYRALADDPGAPPRDVLGPLGERRSASIERLVAATGQRELRDLAPCALVPVADAADRPSPGGNGPAADDFAPIRSAPREAPRPGPARGASLGSFTTDCGRNANGKFNPDNVIVAPGVGNGAHHMHDYVGNQATDAFASDADLAAGATSCREKGDRSTYYWPVLRLQNGVAEDDADADGGGRDGNTGEIRTPARVTLRFVGSPVGKVTAMPRFLRIITGDAKAFTNGTANANASWSCTGFEDRQLKDKYPICPRGSQVVRTFRFQSCWDGRGTDSANHRTHVAFADRAGRCPTGFRAIPQLVQRIVYDVPPGPGFAVDSFPEQLHKPVTDHGDFINVFDERLMRRLVACINAGRVCR
ncbi:DUF1996 domain-containing protein [Streptomyces sp. NPDC050504]|uniref:DUF1996 domain-containing protein n=1 Tax=Streptomyces sp. NPDC050504 TaxID=3365618 RepID=UPI0037B9A1AC